MPDLIETQLEVKITCYGHASPQWKAAKSEAEADRLNQRLSELRAKNVRAFVERILKREIPKIKIAVPSTGLGSHGVGAGHIRFPHTGDLNSPFDRSVVVDVDLTTSDPTWRFQPQPPRRIYTPSKIWDLTVLSMNKVAGYGVVVFYARIRITNPYSGKSIVLSGWLVGGGAVFSGDKPEGELKPGQNPSANPFDFGSRRLGGKVGHTVSFTVPEPMDFDDWYNLGKGWTVRIDKAQIKMLFATKQTYLVLPQLSTHPESLDFDSKPFGIGWFGGDAYVVSGKLRMEGSNPGDYLELPSPDEIIPTATGIMFTSSIILSFPTGKSAVSDPILDDQQKLTEYVTQKARNIGVFAKTYQFIP